MTINESKRNILMTLIISRLLVSEHIMYLNSLRSTQEITDSVYERLKEFVFGFCDNESFIFDYMGISPEESVNILTKEDMDMLYPKDSKLTGEDYKKTVKLITKKYMDQYFPQELDMDFMKSKYVN